MQILDSSEVSQEEIDSLGHMNVRYYLTRVARANRSLLEQVGLPRSMSGNQTLRQVDTYSRFRREQFVGAPLEVHGGLLEIKPTQARSYFEIRNPAKDEIAASFIVGSCIVDRTNQQHLQFPSEMQQINEAYGVKLPGYAKPRSLTLTPPRAHPTIAELNEKITDEPAPGMMSGQRRGSIAEQDCDTWGYLREEIDLMFIMHRPSADQTASFGPPVLKTDEGHRFSWAMIETRAVTLGRPRANDELISFGADVAFGERWRQSRRWAFIEQTGELIGINDTVGIALDLDARRSIDIPESMRETLTRTCLPELL